MKDGRKPTEEEINQIEQYERDLGSEDLNLREYYIVVFDDYISDCPCYRGKIAVVIFGMPEMVNSYGWNKEGKLIDFTKNPNKWLNFQTNLMRILADSPLEIKRNMFLKLTYKEEEGNMLSWGLTYQ